MYTNIFGITSMYNKLHNGRELGGLPEHLCNKLILFSRVLSQIVEQWKDSNTTHIHCIILLYTVYG